VVSSSLPVFVYSAVVTTGIYCRPGCAAKPLAQNVRTFDHPPAAEAAGFRACYRCRPYRVAGPVPTSAPELVCEAVVGDTYRRTITMAGAPGLLEVSPGRGNCLLLRAQLHRLPRLGTGDPPAMERPTGDTTHSRSDVHRRRVSASQDHGEGFLGHGGRFQVGKRSTRSTATSRCGSSKT
jgi:Metal binding domain of Ada